jgi:hypothetical protein
MKTISRLLLLALFASSPAIAATSPLVGTWVLEKSENPMPNGSVVSYCTGVHGFIIYTEEGIVSVALNCAPEGQGPEPADISGRKFFYTGTYQFDGRRAIHTLLNASQPELIGTSFTRAVTIRDSELILSGVNQGQVFSAVWRRLPR